MVTISKISLNQMTVFEVLFAPDVLIDVLGMLEYSEPPNIKDLTPTEIQNYDFSDRPKHRQYICEKVKFRQVLDMTKKDDLLSKIHQLFRVQYITDCVLPPPSLFEDTNLTTMVTWIFFNKVEIVNSIVEDRELIIDLVNKAKDHKTSNLLKIELGGFLKELCQFAQSLQNLERDSFYSVLAQNQILEVIENMLACSGKDCNKVQSLGGEVLAYLIDWSPSFVRKYCLDIAAKNRNSISYSSSNNYSPPSSPPPPPPPLKENKNDYTRTSFDGGLFPHKKRERCYSSSSSTSTVTIKDKAQNRQNIITLLITQMIHDTDPAHGGAVQLAALLRQLLDAENMTTTRAEINEFLNFFYTRCIHPLVEPIYQITHTGKNRVFHETLSDKNCTTFIGQFWGNFGRNSRFGQD